MPMTYFEAMSRLQQQSFDALKAAQNAQLSALRAVAAPEPALLPVIRDVTDQLFAFSFRLLAERAEFAKTFIDTFAAAAGDSEIGAPHALAEPVAESPATVVSTTTRHAETAPEAHLVVPGSEGGPTPEPPVDATQVIADVIASSAPEAQPPKVPTMSGNAMQPGPRSGPGKSKKPKSAR